MSAGRRLGQLVDGSSSAGSRTWPARAYCACRVKSFSGTSTTCLLDAESSTRNIGTSNPDSLSSCRVSRDRSCPHDFASLMNLLEVSSPTCENAYGRPSTASVPLVSGGGALTWSTWPWPTLPLAFSVRNVAGLGGRVDHRKLRDVRRPMLVEVAEGHRWRGCLAARDQPLGVGLAAVDAVQPLPCARY